MAGDGIGEYLVDLEILFPRVIVVFGVSRTFLHLVMKSRPKDGVAEVSVVTLELTISNKYSKGLVVVSESLADEISSDICQRVGWHAQRPHPHLVL